MVFIVGYLDVYFCIVIKDIVGNDFRVYLDCIEVFKAFDFDIFFFVSVGYFQGLGFFVYEYFEWKCVVFFVVCDIYILKKVNYGKYIVYVGVNIVFGYFCGFFRFVVQGKSFVLVLIKSYLVV